MVAVEIFSITTQKRKGGHKQQTVPPDTAFLARAHCSSSRFVGANRHFGLFSSALCNHSHNNPEPHLQCKNIIIMH